ncbi:serine--tRNA ligase [Candidatus Sneabacter namystus]|uniref:Serine--tRNA ligase n=1 Tax=Candidatus Sneabacter namystus TaxID=2601646 RepID=A0A5C0UIZ3_9RICK|nr:serine--tRNA ligase [Candidatus Sneabacter namystus]QEK39720.1 serine--tRNA ligase [Candidatus Sneabacter namystus]
MLDINWIREKTADCISQLQKRGIDPSVVHDLLNKDTRKRESISKIQALQHERNLLSKQYTNASEEKIKKIKEDNKKIQHQLSEIKKDLENAERELSSILDALPNVPQIDVPFGTKEDDNVEKEKWDSRNTVNSTNLHHIDIAHLINGVEVQKTTEMSGSRFVTLTGKLALLKRALINFMVDFHTQHFSFKEISPPYLVLNKAMYNTGQLPKFSQESFVTEDGYRLIPTAEVSLVNLVANTVLSIESLPLRMVACTPCFRSEAGSAGKDTKGLIRLHQFHKVELISITDEYHSEEEHEYLLMAAKTILEKLNLSYRVVTLCTQDMGFQSSKTYDLEVWMPHENKYREISSCSNCTDFQSRRMKAKYKIKNKNYFLHTLNASGLAIERTIAAVLENYFDGKRLHIPQVLQKYMNNEKSFPVLETKIKHICSEE